MAGLPNATFIGFTGTPVDKTAYGKGTFKTFGVRGRQGLPAQVLDRREHRGRHDAAALLQPRAERDARAARDDGEGVSALAETEGIADIEELNKILDRAVNLKNFLKGKERVKKVAQYVADHYRENVEPLGYKAFLVAVDREACALYKEALDAIPAAGIFGGRLHRQQQRLRRSSRNGTSTRSRKSRSARTSPSSATAQRF